MIKPVEGTAYELKMVNTPYGFEEWGVGPDGAGWTCNLVAAHWVVFERPVGTGGATEAVEFFYSSCCGCWFDEEQWTRLLSIKPVEAPR